MCIRIADTPAVYVYTWNTCVYICVHIYVYMCTHMYTYVYIYMCTCIHICVHIYVYMCTHRIHVYTWNTRVNTGSKVTHI